MKTIGIHFTTLALLICGIVLAGIGLSITLSPSGFYASSGIALGGDASLISELRAPAGMLVVAGLIILTSLWITHLRPYAWFLAALIYLSYGIARVVGFGIDGMPHASIVSAAVIEIILGMISLAMLKGAARSAKNENGVETTAIS